MALPHSEFVLAAAQQVRMAAEVECEGDAGSGGGSVEVYNSSPARYVIVVEGENGEEAPYGLGIDCP